MPKMKSHSGAKKRFKQTGSGKVRARHAMLSHNTGKKSAKNKRRLSEALILKKQDEKRVKDLMQS